MIYQEMQEALELRYDLTLPCQVTPFVSHDHDFVRQLTGETRIPPEMLLVREDTGNLDITLFLEQSLIDSTSGSNANHHSSKQFDAYCTILEGVSHFVYLVWNAQYGRQVKPIEMELQAEVDKFVFSALEKSDHAMTASHPQSRHQSRPKSKHQFLFNSLFRQVKYIHVPGTEMHHRYTVANKFAEQYCGWLSCHFQFTVGDPMLYAELARFYRMNAAAKFEHIKYSTN